MKNKVVTVTVDGREHAISYGKKMKNLTEEYTVQVHDRVLKQKGVDNFRFHVYAQNVAFPDGTKTPTEKTLKEIMAKAIIERNQKK